MQRLHWCLGSLLLGATLIAPVGLQAKDKRQDCPNNGYYDRDHKERPLRIRNFPDPESHRARWRSRPWTR